MPKTLVFVRHGKSGYDAYVGSDMQRHLAERGYADSMDTLRWCQSLDIVPDLIVSSPAIRAYSTALVFANGYAYPPENILLQDAIYEATVQQLLYVVSSFPAKADTVFMFGHNPGFTDVVNFLCGPVLHHLPTAGVAVLKLNAGSWTEVGKKTASLMQAWSGHKRVE
jgi:phosphohistidine phosphatase